MLANEDTNNEKTMLISSADNRASIPWADGRLTAKSREVSGEAARLYVIIMASL